MVEAGGNDATLALINDGTIPTIRSSFITTAGYKPLAFSVGGSERVRIDTSGNVGIGTTGPTYQLQLATDSAGKPNGGSWANSSDLRLKTNIAPISNGLERLTKLNPVSFTWQNPALHGGTAESGGFLAQDVMQEFPSWVTEIDATGADRTLVGPDGKAYSLTLPFEYDAMVVGAIKGAPDGEPSPQRTRQNP